MSKYVDELKIRGKWRYGESCHLTADTVEELMEFAVNQLGMRAEWFQNKPDLPHFDLNAKRRARAVKLGAIQTTTRAMLKRMRAN